MGAEAVNPVARPVLCASQNRSRPFNRFGQIRLDAPRDELLKTFNLHAVTIARADSVIYEATQATSGAQFTGCFLRGTLNEAFVIEPEEQAGPEALQQELINQYGMPTEEIDNCGTTTPPKLLSQSAADDWVSRMAPLPFQRSLVWCAANYYIEASLHYSSADSAQARTIVTLHLRTTPASSKQTLSLYTAHTLSVHSAIE